MSMFGLGKKRAREKWISLVFAQPVMHPEQITDARLHDATERQVVRRREIILESIEIILKTKNEDTRQGRIELCRKHYAFLQEIKPFADRKQLSMIRECETALRNCDVI